MSGRVANSVTQSRIGAAGLVLFSFEFVALMAWTDALGGVENAKSRHLARFIDHAIVGTMGRDLGALLTACIGIVLAIALYTIGNRGNEDVPDVGAR